MSTSSRPPDPRPVLVVADERQRAALAPLLAAYGTERPVLLRTPGADRSAEALARSAPDLAGMLVVSEPRRSPNRLVPGLTVAGTNGPVPVGLVPDRGVDAIRRFAHTAATVHQRARSRPERTIAVLAQRTVRYRDLAGRIVRGISHRSGPDAVLCWTADHLMRDDLGVGLGTGPAVAVYIGHGRPNGWVGYAGTRAHHLADLEQPIAALLSLTCATASRRHTGLSFSEAVIVGGTAATAIGAVGPTDHRTNARWVIQLTRALTAQTATIADLVRVAVGFGEGGSRYRLLGDPLAPLLDAPDARARARLFSAERIFRHDEVSA